MTVSMSRTRTSTTPSSLRITIGSLSSDHTTKSHGKAFFPCLTWRRRAIPVLAVRCDDRNSDLPIELRRTVEDFSGDTDSKDLSTLPRPLTTQFSTSVTDGSRLRVAYQGVPGAYSEAAVEKAYPNCEAVPCEQFDTAFEAVERGIVDRAVLPFENSLGGSIHDNYDLLLQYNLHIVGEVNLAVRHCLMANYGVEIEDLTRVLSHPQALAQCKTSLRRLRLLSEKVDDTAGAAKHVAFHKLKDVGAIASSTAAAIYGLNILARDIQDDSNNTTRFLILAREPIIHDSNRQFKTSIVFSLEKGPGQLHKAIGFLALRRIDLTKIESRPNQQLRTSNQNNDSTEYFEYIFFVDFKASMADQNAKNALRHLKEFSTFLRMLGSYPADTSGIQNGLQFPKHGNNFSFTSISLMLLIVITVLTFFMI